MANREYYDVIIVGGGPAGLSAAIYALRASMRTVLVEKAAPGGQITLTDEVENYPGFKSINGYDLSEKFLSHAKSYSLEVLSQEAVVLEPGLDWHSVQLNGGEQLKTHAIILASGGLPRKLNIPGEDELYGKGVVNDGGQPFRKEPTRAEDIKPGGHASLDGIIQYENRPQFTYARGDATKAYDPKRVKLAQRDVVYLREISRPHPIVIVFDRVEAHNSEFEKRFLLHNLNT